MLNINGNTMCVWMGISDIGGNKMQIYCAPEWKLKKKLAQFSREKKRMGREKGKFADSEEL